MARLIISDGTSQRTVELSEPITTIGRSTEAKVVIEDKQCSRVHCHFEKTDVGYKLVDLESRNGTRVNDRVVNQALLRPGDRVQIGKHSLTFEDPAFREPPAAVAAAVSAPPPPPSAVQAAAPAGAMPPSEPRIRRRTGATTSIERSVRIEVRKEKQLITYIAVGAAVFVGLLIVLIMLPSGGETPAARQARQTYEKGRALFHQGKLDEAHLTLSRVPADPKTIHAQAQSLLREIEAARQRLDAALGVEQRKEFDDLYDFCEKNRANPRAYETIVQRCETFKQKYPKHPQTAKVDEWLALGLEGRKAARSTELEGAERQSQEALKKDDYATALRLVNGVRERFRDELTVRERLDKLRDEILDKARTHTFRKRAEAQDAAARGRKDEAIRILESVVISMGDGNVEELAEFALLARTGLQGLK